MSEEAHPATERSSLPSPLYAILDPAQAKDRSLFYVLTDLLAGGARIIQLRAKDLTSSEFYRLAIEARDLTRRAGCLFIVNDRVDIAMVSHADGVHLGQDDLPLAVARRLMGREKIIGISTHDLAQGEEAEREGADYIGFGPIFGTATKHTGYSARGIETLRQMCKTVNVPIVAIGGVTESNVQQVWDAGANAAAIITDIMGAEDVMEKVKRILGLHKSTQRISSR